MSELNEEFNAMSTIATLLEKMDEETRTRVINWAADKFAVNTRIATPTTDRAAIEPVGSTDFPDFVDLYDQVNPSDQTEKALTGAYWFQVIQSQPSWQAQEINSALKDTGNGVTGIAHVFERAQAKKPALVRQIVKSGKSRQARKTYKLTSAGIKFIADRIHSLGLEESK